MREVERGFMDTFLRDIVDEKLGIVCIIEVTKFKHFLFWKLYYYFSAVFDKLLVGDVCELKYQKLLYKCQTKSTTYSINWSSWTGVGLI